MEKSQSFVSVVTVIDIERAHCVNVIPQLQLHLDKHFSDYEIVLIVLKDAQSALALHLARMMEKIPAIRYLQLASNSPIDVAISAGLENAIGDFIVLWDLETDPIECVSQSVELCKGGADVVIGIAKAADSKAYEILRPFANWLLSSADYRLPRNATSLRCLSRRAANTVMATRQFHQQLFMCIQKSGYDAAQLSYQFLKARPKTVFLGMRETLQLLVFNSAAPLRMMSLLGLSGSAFACLFSLYALLLRFFRDDVMSGWASTVLIISFFALLQFVILAFISEYLARLLIEQSHPQSYSVVYEKNSLVMVNQDRINVLENSINNEQNLVQTGRDC